MPFATDESPLQDFAIQVIDSLPNVPMDQAGAERKSGKIKDLVSLLDDNAADAMEGMPIFGKDRREVDQSHLENTADDQPKQNNDTAILGIIDP